MAVPVKITDRTMQLMGMGRTFKDTNARINSIDFHRTEDLLVTGADDDTIIVYNTAEGVKLDTLLTRKYGVSNICLTHASSCVLYATRKAPQHTADTNWWALRYHDLQRNEYMRYFKGHAGPVTGLCLSPKNDMFMSCSQDKTMRLWDLRTSICQGILNAPSVPCASFDQQGLVFAVASDSGVIKLYDIRTYDKGPFDTFVVPEEAQSPGPFTHVRFSNDGNRLLACVEGRLYVLDAFKGSVQAKFSTGTSEGLPAMEATFSPDCQYVLSGCEDRSIRVWNINSGQQVAALTGQPGLPTCLKFAPRRLLLASACQALILWIPPVAALEHA